MTFVGGFVPPTLQRTIPLLGAREDMKRVLEDHRVLSGYVDFVSTQFHKAIDDEQLGHDKQVGAAVENAVQYSTVVAARPDSMNISLAAAAAAAASPLIVCSPAGLVLPQNMFKRTTKKSCISSREDTPCPDVSRFQQTE